MIVIEKLEELKNLYAPVLEDLMMEILRGLNAYVSFVPVLDRFFPWIFLFFSLVLFDFIDCISILCSPNLEIREKIISIALDLVTSRNAEEVIVYLKKEVQKSQHDTFDGVCSSFSPLPLSYFFFFCIRTNVYSLIAVITNRLHVCHQSLPSVFV